MAFNAGGPLSFKSIIDLGLIGRNRRILLYILGGLGGGVVLVSLVGLGRDYLYAKVLSRLLSDIRLRMFQHLQQLSMDFYSRSQIGDVLSRIVSGAVFVLKADPSGEQKRIAVLQDGDHFGEIALLRNVPRTATIRTLTPCLFLSLQREQFSYLLSKAEHFRQDIENVLRARMHAPGATYHHGPT